VHAANQVADARLARAQRELAGRRTLDAHLLFNVCDDSAVALSEAAVLIHVVLGHDEHRKARRAGLAAFATSKNKVDDVLVVVLLP